jgi:hypothetical protein
MSATSHAMVDAHARERRNAVQSLEITASRGLGLVRAKDTVTVRVLAERHLDAVQF